MTQSFCSKFKPFLRFHMVASTWCFHPVTMSTDINKAIKLVLAVLGGDLQSIY